MWCCAGIAWFVSARLKTTPMWYSWLKWNNCCDCLCRNPACFLTHLWCAKLSEWRQINRPLIAPGTTFTWQRQSCRHPARLLRFCPALSWYVQNNVRTQNKCSYWWNKFYPNFTHFLSWCWLLEYNSELSTIELTFWLIRTGVEREWVDIIEVDLKLEMAYWMFIFIIHCV